MSERESFRVVIPHVRTALALSCRLQAGQQGELARSALAQRGCIALRHDAGVMLMEGPPVERLRAAGALVLAGGKLAWAHPVVQRECERILARVVAGAAAGPCALGLSPCGLAIECELVPIAESRLVGIVGAVDARVIASNLGIAHETVRTHATHVYSKAGVKSRAAFSALVQSLRERWRAAQRCMRVLAPYAFGPSNDFSISYQPEPMTFSGMPFMLAAVSRCFLRPAHAFGFACHSFSTRSASS
jgi:hypothetical protein